MMNTLRTSSLMSLRRLGFSTYSRSTAMRSAKLMLPAITLAVGFGRVITRAGVGPDARLGVQSLWYGIRGRGSTVATNLTARLDVPILPADVSTANVGIYSVAANVSLIVYALANTFSGLVLPAAAREPERASLKVIGSLWAVLLIAAALAGVLALFA